MIILILLVPVAYYWGQPVTGNEAREAKADKAGLFSCEKGDYYQSVRGERHCRDLKGTKQRAEWVARINQFNADMKTKRDWEQLNFCVSNLEPCLAGNQTACRMYCNGPVGSDSCEESFKLQSFC